MTHNTPDHDVVLTCPRCDKHGFVRLEHELDKFECVYCHYTDHLNSSSSSKKELGIGFLPFVLLILALTLLVM
ncbi:MAG: YheV family putative metal-binding protein [Leptolyngbyaceae bacterium]|nr:YheV family putative metal-binding protein [Leptolyngbyaceae bacterium]